MASPDPFSPMVPIVLFDEVDSTNAEARRRAAKGERGPLWIRALRQTAGIGRAGRSWQSPPGNLAATLLFAPACPAHRLPELSLLAGLATAEAIAAELDAAAAGASVRPEPILKWPNDVLIDGAKCAGVLVESASQGAVLTAAIGIGINVLVAPAVDGRPTTALAQYAPAASTDRLMSSLVAAVDRWLTIWQGPDGFAPVRAAWLARTVAVGTSIAVHVGGHVREGSFAGLDSDGALVMSSPEGLRRVTHGDVSVAAKG